MVVEDEEESITISCVLDRFYLAVSVPCSAELTSQYIHTKYIIVFPSLIILLTCCVFCLPVLRISTINPFHFSAFTTNIKTQSIRLWRGIKLREGSSPHPAIL